MLSPDDTHYKPGAYTLQRKVHIHYKGKVQKVTAITRICFATDTKTAISRKYQAYNIRHPGQNIEHHSEQHSQTCQTCSPNTLHTLSASKCPSKFPIFRVGTEDTLTLMGTVADLIIAYRLTHLSLSFAAASRTLLAAL